MLDVMRSRSSLAYIILGGIIVLLAVSAGPGAPGCGKNTLASRPWAAKVNGDVVSSQEYASMLSQRLEMLRQLSEEHGSPFDIAMAERLGLKRYVIDQLIERRLIAQAAQASGVRISDDELLRYLRSQYGVHNVAFDDYQNYIRERFGVGVDKFEAMARGDAGALRLASVVRDTVALTDDELRQQYFREHDRLKFQYVRFDIEPDVQPDPSATQVQKLIAEAPDRVESAYNRELLRWRIPEAVHIRHILRTLAPDADEKAIAEQRALLIGLRDQVASGADFAALAQAQSQDEASKDKGGDLGFVDRGSLAPAMDAVAFALSAGQMASEPVRTAEGLHLVQLIDSRQASRQPLEEARLDVAAFVLKKEAAQNKAQKKAQALLAALQAGQPLARLTEPEDSEENALSTASSAAANKRPKLRESSWVLASDEGLPRIGEAPALKAALFAQKQAPTLVRQVFPVGEAFYVTALKARERPDMAAFAEQKTAQRDEALSQKRRRIFTAWLSQLRSQARVEVNAQLVNAPLAAPSQQPS